MWSFRRSTNRLSLHNFAHSINPQTAPVCSKLTTSAKCLLAWPLGNGVSRSAVLRSRSQRFRPSRTPMSKKPIGIATRARISAPDIVGVTRKIIGATVESEATPHG